MSASIIDVANAANATNSTVVNLTSPSSSSSTFETAPLNPAFIAYRNNTSIKPQVIGGRGTGLIPTPVDLSHLSPIYTPLSFPAVYDLRALNKVTPVKDQGTAGVCWTFGTYGSLESCLMPAQQWSFSENNMKNVLSSAAPQGFDRGPEDGGNYLESTAYLSRWSGPVNTSDDPYSATSVYSPAELGMPIQKHVQNVYFLPDRQNSTDNNQIKSALQTFGAVAVGMYYDSNPVYFNTATNSYYDNVAQTSGNHAVTIVGWDDNYNKQNFSIVPPGNGAFIVKNSWGKGYGENGYFYVSYYDPNFATTGVSAAVFTAENTNNYKNIYQYDPLGWVGNFGSSSGTNPTCWGANVFTATSNDPLEAVSFYTTDSNCNYNLYIGSSNLASRTLVQSGTIPMAGYHTIPLNSAIPLTIGQKFSVIITLTFPNPNPTNSNDYHPMVVEGPLSGYSSKAIANASESFISLDGNSWTDMTAIAPNMDICIKAFTGTNTTPIPTVSSILPTSGPSTGGTTVMITGQGFTGASKVNFGPTAATNFVVGSDTMINATAPAGTGTDDVTVTTPGGTSATSSNDLYTFIVPNPVNLSFNLQKVKLHPGSSQTIQILMNQVPANGLAGFNITVSVLDPTITNITAVSSPSWSGVSSNSTVPSGSVWITAANFGQVKAGDTNVSFGNITVTGIKEGTTNLIIVPTEIDDNNGYLINPNVVACQVNVTLVKPFPDCTNSPTDLNDDGFYEDINGNGRLDFADVVKYFNNMAWIPQNEPVTYFDYNRNGRIDFSDVVNLFNMKSS